MKDYKIREGIHGYFFYHLSLNGKPICGTENMTMETNLPFKTWGMVTHIKERYCKDCDVMMKKDIQND